MTYTEVGFSLVPEVVWLLWLLLAPPGGFWAALGSPEPARAPQEQPKAARSQTTPGTGENPTSVYVTYRSYSALLEAFASVGARDGSF